MPEMPEVETIRCQLEKKVINKKIEETIIKDKRLIKEVSPDVFKSRTEGSAIQKILRRGKVLILQMEGGFFTVLHLRISGWIIVGKSIDKFSRVIFRFSDNTSFQFCDQRALGEIKLTEDWQSLPIVKKMGPEVLDLKREDFIALFKGKKSKIKPLLMDQPFLAGVGNAYAQEAVFCAGIHPSRTVNSLKENELGRIYDCLTAILKEAIKRKGSSLDTYRQIDGKEGGYAPFLKVYGRKGKPCFKCGSPIKREVIGGRGTYFCSHCQK